MKFKFLILISLFPQIALSQSDNTINEEVSLKIVQKHIEHFNNINMDSLFTIHHKNILICNFPNDTLFYNHDKSNTNRKNYFKNIKKSHVRMLNTITLNNIVISEQLTNINNSAYRNIVLYFTTNNNIKSVTFINNTPMNINPETIVNIQLEAYNTRNIEAFTATYTDTIKLYKFPSELFSEGHEGIRRIYDPLFKNTPNLNAEIVNRIVLGNIVIDKEKVTMNDRIFYAIAIYEIENDKISKVTFIK